MTETTNQTAKYSKNYSGDVGETPKPMTGTWHLEAPDGRRWAGSGPLNCVAQEISERVPLQVQLARVLAIADEPDLDERHTKLGVEYDTVKVDELVDKLYAEIEALRAKLEALEKQEPSYLMYPNGRCGLPGRPPLDAGHADATVLKLYLAAGARPVEPAPQQDALSINSRAQFLIANIKESIECDDFDGASATLEMLRLQCINPLTDIACSPASNSATPQPAPAAVEEPQPSTDPSMLADELVRLADILRDCGRLVSKSGTGERVLRASAEALRASSGQESPRRPCGGRGYCDRMPFCGCGSEPELPERNPNAPAEQQGLFRKFEIRRVDGSDQLGGKHHGCRYFVLDIDHDQYAVAALSAYAQACETTHPDLARDLREKWGAAMAEDADRPDVNGSEAIINVVFTIEALNEVRADLAANKKEPT